ncbi:MAG: hypothetical protein ACI8ZH_000047 [Flavobacteriales bacterium]|jgi:hypothetical protein
MKKIYSLMVVAILGTTTMFGQGFGVGLDYMMLSGTMVKDTAGNAVEYLADANDTEATAVSSSSAVLSLNYTHNLSEKMDLVGSVGYGMGFGIVPLKASLSYGFSPSISANLGMGLYMITDDSYVPTGYADGANADGYLATDPGATGSTNEFGMNLGLKYHMNNIGIGLGYEMIKDSDHSSLNAFTIGLSYAFGSSSEKGDKPAKEKKPSKAKK